MGAQAVVLTPLYGIPVDWEAVDREATRYGAALIEDAAQGHGASYRGRRLGSLGSLSILSFGRGKGWTGGAGGALLDRSTESAEPPGDLMPSGVRREFGTFFRAFAQHTLGRPGVYGILAGLPWLGLGETKYREPSAPSEIGRTAAGLVRACQALADREAAARRLHGVEYRAAIDGEPGLVPIRAPAGSVPGYLRFPVLVPAGLGGFCDPMQALRLGIAPSYPSTLAALPAVRERLVKTGGPWRGAEELARCLVTLPTHSLTTASERAEVLHLLHTYPV